MLQKFNSIEPIVTLIHTLFWSGLSEIDSLYASGPISILPGATEA